MDDVIDERDNADQESCVVNASTPPKKCKVVTRQKRSQKYTQPWENEFSWLKKDPDCDTNAKCIICGVIFSISSAGVGHIKQHQDTKQHKAKTELKRTSGVLQKFLTPASTSRPVSENDNVTATTAELALSFHTVKHNLSYNSMDCSVKLDKIIYADSKTATDIKLARTKMEALIMEVLGPYALESVVNDLKDENMYFFLQTDASNKKTIK